MAGSPPGEPALQCDPMKYIDGAFDHVDDIPPKVLEIGRYVEIDYGKVQTTRGLMHVPAGTKGSLRINIGTGMCDLHDYSVLNGTDTVILRMPLLEVLAPELFIQHRPETTRTEHMRLRWSDHRDATADIRKLEAFRNKPVPLLNL